MIDHTGENRWLEWRSNGPEDTRRFGMRLGDIVQSGSIICLTGDLGAGKTTFAKGIAAGLGVADLLVSPTFTIIREYFGGRLPLYHMDLYRLADVSECDELGLDEYFYGGGVCVVEWPQIYMEWMPSDRIEARIEHRGAEMRMFALRAVGEQSAAIVERWRRACEC